MLGGFFVLHTSPTQLAKTKNEAKVVLRFF